MEERIVRPDRFWKLLSIVLMVVLAALTTLVLVREMNPRPVFYEAPHAAQRNLAGIQGSPAVNHDSIYWIADLAQQALPFVVNIQALQTPQKTEPTDQGATGDMMEQFKQLMPNPFGPEMPNNGQPQQYKEFQLPQNHPPIGGEGSGFIIREDGYVVTNAHVVEGADTFKIHLNDGKEVDAKLIGMDKFKDIAVLKMDGNNYPVAMLGDSNATRIGEPVVAIGSPLGFEASVTSGIVSTTRRTLEDLGRGSDSRKPQTYIQTDAAINQGNSGGPLLNANSEVIGVNQAIVRWESDVNGFGGNAVPVEGIGFAIPINQVKASIEQIIKVGKVTYPGIMAEILAVSDFKQINPNVKLDVDSGIMVNSVVEGGPAAKAGIEAGDVILSIDDKDLATADEFISAVTSHQVGDRVRLRVARQGTKRIEQISLVLGELDTSQMRAGD